MSRYRYVQVRLDPELVDWFETHMPFATKQDFLEQCLLSLRLAVENGVLPLPGVYPARSAIEAAQILNRNQGKDENGSS